MKYTIALMALISMLFSGTGSAADTPTLEQIKKSETIRIGYRETEPPMSFLNKDNQPIGYSIELCLHIVNEVKKVLKNPNIATRYVPVTATNRFEALRDNSIDILCGATTKTLSTFRAGRFHPAHVYYRRCFTEPSVVQGRWDTGSDG